jgi:hypothetical protein
MHSFASSLDKQLSLDRDREMAERSNAAVLKTVELRGSGGSNPSLSTQRLRIFGAVSFSPQYSLSPLTLCSLKV